MTLYMAFTPAERIAIKASNDAMVKEFWSMYELSVQLDKPTDPNLASVRDIIAYRPSRRRPVPAAAFSRRRSGCSRFWPASRSK